MKKSTLAIILALALTLSLGSAAFAADPIKDSDDSTGNITFVRGDEETRDEGIYDARLASLGLDFGEVEYNKSADPVSLAKYESIKAVRNDKDLQVGDRYAGLEVVHRQLAEEVQVTVKVGGFEPGTFDAKNGYFVPDSNWPGVGGPGSVLQGFELKLIPSTDPTHKAQDGTYTVVAKEATISAKGGVAGDAYPVIQATGLGPFDTAHVFSQLYAGELTVPNGASSIVDIPTHDAQATLVWTYEAIV